MNMNIINGSRTCGCWVCNMIFTENPYATTLIQQLQYLQGYQYQQYQYNFTPFDTTKQMSQLYRNSISLEEDSLTLPESKEQQPQVEVKDKQKDNCEKENVPKPDLPVVEEIINQSTPSDIHPAKRRTPGLIACPSCRKLHTKCDTVKPCRRCMNIGLSEECREFGKYEEKSKLERKMKRKKRKMNYRFWNDSLYE